MAGAFFTGLFIGVFLGVIVTAIVSINRLDQELEKPLDTDRLDFLDEGKRSLTFYGGDWAVVEGTPPKVVGRMEPTVREAIDSARTPDGVNNGG